jgi:outer membrane protein assembly factor BamB
VKKSKDRALFSGPVLASDRLVVVSTDGRAIALNPKTGDILKTLKIGAPVLTSPVAVNGMIYVVTDKGELVAIR